MIHVGIGYDVHQLVPGRKLILGGVDIPHTRGLDGHSDADALMHAVTDAVLEEVAEWQARPLEPLYPLVFLDALRVKVRDEGTVRNKAVYVALGAAKRAAAEHGSLMPPAHILNAPTKLMKNLGYGSGYQYDHDAEDSFSGQNYFPDAIGRKQFYEPVERGFEREIRKRLDYWARLRAERNRG